MKPFWDEYQSDIDDFLDSDVMAGLYRTDEERLIEHCNNILIGRHPDIFPWPTQMEVPNLCIKGFEYLMLN